MKKYEWLNIDFILAKANRHLIDHGYQLIKPDPSREICYEVGKFWLVDLSGEIILEGVDIADYSGGFNLLKLGEPFGFKHFITELYDGLLYRAGHYSEQIECDICNDLRNSGASWIDDIWEEELDDIEPDM